MDLPNRGVGNQSNHRSFTNPSSRENEEKSDGMTDHVVQRIKDSIDLLPLQLRNNYILPTEGMDVQFLHFQPGRSVVCGGFLLVDFIRQLRYLGTVCTLVVVGTVP